MARCIHWIRKGEREILFFQNMARFGSYNNISLIPFNFSADDNMKSDDLKERCFITLKDLQNYPFDLIKTLYVNKKYQD